MREPSADRVPLAVSLIVAGVFLLSAVDAAVKAVSADYSVWQIYVARSLFSVGILVVLIWFGSGGAVRDVMHRWVVVRSCLMVAMWIAYYAALPAIPLSVAATGIYTAPLMIALLSSLLSGEAVGRTRWAGIALGFLGVVVILRPGADDFAGLSFLPILLAALLYALAAIVTRTHCTSESPFVLALGLHVGLLIAGIVGSLAIVLLQPDPSYPFLLGGWTPMGSRDWLIMAALGIVMVVVAVAVAKAYQSGPPAVIATFDYSYLVFAAAWGVLFFAEKLDALTIAGIVMIVGAGMLVLKRSD